MAKQTFTTGQVLTAAQMTSLQQTAMGGGSTTAKTASYVLVAADAGTVVQMNSASATTITVNTALFAAGDTVQIQNVGAGVCTVTAGTATVSTAGSLALSQYEGGQLYFNTTSAALFFDVVQAAAAAAFVGVSLSGAALSVANSTATAVPMNAEIYDTDAFHSTTVNNTRITIPAGKGGYYLVQVNAQFGANSTGTRQALVYKNGASFFEAPQVGGLATGTGPIGVTVMNLIATDYLELFVFQNSGGALTVYPTTANAAFSASFLGA